MPNPARRSTRRAAARMATRPTTPALAGTVAVVAGATRGAGRGIARALGEAGAVVYCTGRSVRGSPSAYKRPETIEETAEMITAAGGKAVALRVDHTVEAEVRALFDRVSRDHGRVDVLVNSVAGEDPMMAQWAPFWKANLTNGEAILRQALLSHIITAKYAAALMIKKRRGLIVEVTENDMLMAGGNIVTQVVKAGHKMLAAIWAGDLRRHGVAAIAITPGFLRSETMLEGLGVTEETWRDAGKKDKNFLESESPLFVGRAIVALACDPKLFTKSGQVFSSWEVGRQYRVTDYDGRRPDWGTLDVDYSMLPASLLEAIMDHCEVQVPWLKVLSRRIERYRANFAKAMQQRQKPASKPSRA
jgi:NAD(P)-dependent dehydrogenase (short-subunit alcohol dehydrogenase family)